MRPGQEGEVGGGEVAGQTSVGLLACAAARAFACSLLEKRVCGGVAFRSWESVVLLVWRQPEWVARCTVVIDVQQFPFSISRAGKRKRKIKQHSSYLRTPERRCT